MRTDAARLQGWLSNCCNLSISAGPGSHRAWSTSALAPTLRGLWQHLPCRGGPWGTEILLPGHPKNPGNFVSAESSLPMGLKGAFSLWAFPVLWGWCWIPILPPCRSVVSFTGQQQRQKPHGLLPLLDIFFRRDQVAAPFSSPCIIFNGL